MNANWYDVLDVETDSSAEEVRAAWKSAIEDLDPTDRRFRVYNQAAGVLMDEKSRAEYDAKLAADKADEADQDDESAAADTAEEESTQPGPVSLGKDPRNDRAEARPTAGAVPGWLLAAVGALTLAAVLAVAALWWLVPSSQATEDAGSEAEQTAQRAATAMFSYDYTRLDADQRAAAEYMTTDYRKDYDPLFEVVRQNAPALKMKTSVEVQAAGIVRNGAGRDADDRVQVLVLWNQQTTNKQTPQPSIVPSFATLTMEKVDGSWLVDDVKGPPIQD